MMDSKLKVKVISQGSLTSDCWLVQFNGLDACKTCEAFNTDECGGGKVLAKLICDTYGDSRMSMDAITRYYFNIVTDEDGDEQLGTEKDNTSFYDMVQQFKDSYKLQHGLKKYRTVINMHRISEKDKPENAISLDELHPFKVEFNNKENVIEEQSGYHQHLQCTCTKTTAKGSYRDVTIKDKSGNTLYYYHQHLILKRIANTNNVIIDSCGFRTMTTLERINRYLIHTTVSQRKYVWYIHPKYNWEIKGLKLYDGMMVADIPNVN